ncbi:hypothetical protein [Mycolicibacterium pulveris]|uniref:hypothetical protein n=1 Tax=Mycolicibacterium pulveris TaxID=36813 RepID=UPI003CF1C276
MRSQATSLALCAAGATVLITAAGCGHGPSGGGSGSPEGSSAGAAGQATAVEHAYIVPQFIPGRCSIAVGGQAELRFTVANHRPSGIERLLDITIDAADTVQYSTDAPVEIWPGTSVAFGQRQVKPVGAKGFSIQAIELEGLNADARPGTSVAVTFGFERSGDIDIQVPIQTCRSQT